MRVMYPIDGHLQGLKPKYLNPLCVKTRRWWRKRQYNAVFRSQLLTTHESKPPGAVPG